MQMNQNRQQRIHNLEGKIPIKNPHLVQSLHIHNNNQIFVVYNSYIHIHSTQKIASFLPSLICMIELSEIAKKIEKQKYQDGLSEKIVTSDKSKFGEIVFGEDLDTDNNKLVSITHLRERLRFLGSQFVRVKSIDIHTLGHLLVVFEDRRCVLIKRKSPFALSQQSNSLYNTTNPILLNNLINNPIITSIFTNTFLDINVFTFHLSSKQSLDSTISRISISDGETEDKHQVYCIPEGKRKSIESKGLIKMSYVSHPTDKDKQNGSVIFLYYHKIVLLDVGKFNNKNKTFQNASQKQLDLSSPLKEYVINSWQYFYSKPQRQIRMFLLTSTGIWELQLNFENRNKEPSSWQLSIKQKIEHTPKSNVYWVNFKGQFMQYIMPTGSQPNYVAHFAAQTDNGMLVRLIANGTHYQEGYLYLGYPSRSYLIEKMHHNLKAKQNGDRPWVNFTDVGWLKRYPQIKKQLIKQLHELRAKQKEQPGLAPQIEFRKHLQLSTNIALEHHSQKIKQLTSQLISQKHPKYNPTHCSISNKKITTQDVLYCEQCQLYSIKQYSNDRCCYICWNVLYSVQ